MSLTINRVLPAILSVSRNTAGQNKLPRTIDQTALLSPVELEKEMQTEQIDIKDLILSLESIAKDRLGERLGFHENKSSKNNNINDSILGKRARYLANSLTKNPTTEILEASLEFLELIDLIEPLESIAKERTEPGFGLRPAPKSQEDKSFGEKILQIIRSLVINPNERNIKIAIKFLGVFEIILELERACEENSRAISIGFKSLSKGKEELKIADNATKLANALKKYPTRENIKLANGFLELVGTLN